ncbi:MAG: DUF2199 domain-containing protein [Hyphomonadaceae bacterium]|nr:DUF2199 domain-containing protein [Hyphomonadaceae bacterium]
MTPDNDPRWARFNAQGMQCSCGERHVGLFPIHIQTPLGWPGSKTYEPDDALRMDGDFLSRDLCVWEGKYFSMRVRLPLQINGAAPAAFMYAAWASFNRPDFEGYLDARRNGRLNKTARAQARLVNRLSGFPDTFKLMGSAFQQEDGGPPLLLIHGPQPDNDPNHPLISQQRQGIGVDRMFELFAAYEHNMLASSS